MSNYRVESQIKQMYCDLMNARAKAMERNRKHFMTLAAKQYAIYDDDSNGSSKVPDGDWNLQSGSGGYTQVMQVNTNCTIIPALAFGATRFYFDDNGLISLKGSMRLDTDLHGDGTPDAYPDYDCIVLSQTRINLGKWEECDCSHAGNECCVK